MNASTTQQGRRCKATTKAGRPCSCFALHGSEYCFSHAPELAEKRREARSRGGRARHGRTIGQTPGGYQVEIKSLSDVVKLLERTINDALSLENSLSRANTIARLAQVLANIYQVSELEQRIAALEAK